MTLAPERYSGHVVNWLAESVEKENGKVKLFFYIKMAMKCLENKITPTKDKHGNHIGYCGVTSPLKEKILIKSA